MSAEREAEVPRASTTKLLQVPSKAGLPSKSTSTDSASTVLAATPMDSTPSAASPVLPVVGRKTTGSTNPGEDSIEYTWLTASPVGGEEQWASGGGSPVDDAAVGRLGKLADKANLKEAMQVAKKHNSLEAVEEQDTPDGATPDFVGGATPAATTQPGSASEESAIFRAPPGLLEPDQPPSEGSKKHPEGNCSPCVWFHKPQGCTRGPDCGYCHICPDGEIKARKKAKLAGIRPGQDDGEDLGDDESPEAEKDEEASFSVEDLPEEIPSLGSAKHGSGDCRPCAWFHKPGGCTNARECRHCHLCPEGEIRNRKKTKVTAIRSTVSERPPPMGHMVTMSSMASMREPVRPPPGLGPAPGLGPPAMGKSFTEPVKSTIQLAEGALAGFVSGPVDSAGSKGHSTRECRPCAWYWKPQGCENGKDCRHCHLCDEGEIRSRKKAKAVTQRPDKAEADADMASMMGAMPSLSAPFFSNSLASMMPMIPTVPPGDLLNFTGEYSQRVQAEFKQREVQAGGPPPSIGSALHAQGLCRPCAWFWKPKGCENGSECRHCHLCPEGEIQARRKSKLTMLRQQKGGPEIGQDASPSRFEMEQLVEMEKQYIANWEMNMAAWAACEAAQAAQFADGSPVDQSPFLSSIMEHSPAMLETIGESSPAAGMDDEEIRLHAAAMAAAADARSSGTPMYADGDDATPSGEGDERGLRSPAILNLDESLTGTSRSAAYERYSMMDSVPSMYSMMDSVPSMVDPTLSMPMVNARSVVDPGTVTGSLTVTDEEVTPAGASSGTSSGQLPSLGSSLHGTGTCRPCAWFHKAGGCLNAQSCAHCHLCPEGELKNRKRAKENAMRVGAIAPSRSLNTRSPRVVKIAPILGA
jgi:hypothetical protein